MIGFLGWLRAFAFAKPAPMPADEPWDHEVTVCSGCHRRLARCTCEAK
jgi:hypothetical protein